MWLKIIIVMLLIAIVASLFGALGFLLKDANMPQSRRTWYALGVRITLAVLLMICLIYGFASGILHSQAPWDHRL